MNENSTNGSNEEKKDLMELFISLNRILHRYQGFSQRSFGPFGNPHRGQGRVLSILKMQPVISQKELGYLLDMRNQSLGELLNKLERNGYITRTPSEEDRRTTNISLTPEGEAAVNESTETKFEQDALFGALSEDEQARLREYLERIIANLRQKFSDAYGGMKDFGGDREAWFEAHFGGKHPHHGHHGLHDRRHGGFGRGGHSFEDLQDAMGEIDERFNRANGFPRAERFDPDHDGPVPNREDDPHDRGNGPRPREN